MMDPAAIARDFITTFEDGGSTDPRRTHSMDPHDSGNWTGAKCGVGQCVGSNHGVTPATLAAFRGVPVSAITVAVMHALTVDEAARLAVQLVYKGQRLNLLPWDQVAPAVLDFQWGTRPGQAAKLLQRIVGADDDGHLGPATVAAYRAKVAAIGIEAMGTAFCDARDAFYRLIAKQDPEKQRYVGGWTRRTAHFRPGGALWARFDGRQAA